LIKIGVKKRMRWFLNGADSFSAIDLLQDGGVRKTEFDAPVFFDFTDINGKCT